MGVEVEECAVRSAGLAVVVWASIVVGMGGCDSDGEGPEDGGVAPAHDEPTWVCEESAIFDSLSCLCFYAPPLCEDLTEEQRRDGGVCVGSGIIGNDRVRTCEDYGCCLLEEDPDNPFNRRCACVESAEGCEAEAASRPGTTVVESCPAAELAGECAPEGRNCSKEYLSQEGLNGCCEGSICAPSAEGVLVCRAAAPGEAELARQCERAARKNDEVLTLQKATLTTSLGTLDFGGTVFDMQDVSYAQDGSIASVSWGMGTSGCSLGFRAGPARDAMGRLELHYVFLNGRDCVDDAESALVLADSAELIDGTLTLEPLTCEGQRSFCSVGTGTMELPSVHGNVPGLEFNAQEAVRFTFSVCGWTASGP